ncbi:hypothetical protein ACF0H5_014013 [Mactra antiquata]
MTDNYEEDYGDDDVIFEGSPLFTSLAQAGSLAEELGMEFEKTKLNSEDDINHTTSVQNDAVAKVHKRTNVVDVVCKACGALYSVIKSFFMPSVRSVYINCKAEIVQKLLTTPCLEEEDSDYLEFYIKTQYGTSPISTTRHIVYILLEAIPCLLAVLYSSYMNYDKPVGELSLISLLPWLIPAIFLVRFSVYQTLKYMHRRKCNNEICSIDTFIKDNEKFTSIVKKCLRLIQETELISRGFTLVSHRNPLSRIEDGQKSNIPRQCPTLRKLVFTYCRDGVFLYREIIKKLLEIHPLCSELDVHGNYLAFEPLQSYGPCLQINDNDHEQLFALTDGFSVAALKGINHLFCLHQSELIKTIALILQEKPFQDSDIIDVKINCLLSEVSSKLQDWATSLQKSHDFHSFDWLKKDDVKREPQVNTEQQDILIAVHSLDLHLQAALTRVRAVSEILENSTDGNQLPMKPEELLDKMNPVKAELESCKGCWEESLNRIEKAAGKLDKDKASNDLVKPVVDNDLKKDHVKYTKIEDYIIEDQVFEAYTDHNHVPTDNEWEQPLTAEEKEKKRKEKQEALRMLTELKSVISVRAVETERRERAAILRMHPELQNNETTDLDRDLPSSFKPSDTVVDQCKAGLVDQTVESAEPFNEVNEKQEKECEQENGSKTTSDMFHLSINESSPHSVTTSLGVRRLRKSNMLDLSDSDDGDYPDEGGEVETGISAETNHAILSKTEFTSGEFVDGDSDSENVTDFVPFKLPAATLEERLEKIAGAKFGFSSDLAMQAVAKRRDFGGLNEETFGGDVYGELSDDDDHDNDGNSGDDDELCNK